MICPYCRQQTPDGAQFCSSCGTGLTNTVNAGNPFGYSENPYAPSHAPPPQKASDDRALRWIVPIGTSAWCIVSGYTGLISFGCCILGPVAIVTGIMGLKELKRRPDLSGMGRAIFGIIAGVLSTIMLLIMIPAMLLGR